MKQVVPAGLLGRIVEGMETGRVRTSKWDAYSRRVKTRLLGGEVDYNVLAFRVFIISRMNTILSHDSRGLCQYSPFIGQFRLSESG